MNNLEYQASILKAAADGVPIEARWKSPNSDWQKCEGIGAVLFNFQHFDYRVVRPIAPLILTEDEVNALLILARNCIAIEYSRKANVVLAGAIRKLEGALQ